MALGASPQNQDSKIYLKCYFDKKPENLKFETQTNIVQIFLNLTFSRKRKIKFQNLISDSNPRSFNNVMKNLIKDHSVIMSRKFGHPSSPLLYVLMSQNHQLPFGLFPNCVTSFLNIPLMLWKIDGRSKLSKIYLNNGLFVRHSGPIWWPDAGQNCPLFRCHVHIRQVTKNINSGLVRLIESEYSGVMNTGFVWSLSVWNSSHDLYASLELKSLYIFSHVTDHGSISLTVCDLFPTFAPVKSYSKFGCRGQIGRKTVYEIDPHVVVFR